MPPVTFKNSVNQLTWNVPIANPNGTPTVEFQRKWLQQAATNASIVDLTTAGAVSAVLDIISAVPGALLERGATQWGGLASPNDATKFLNGAAFPAYAKVKDTDLAVTDVTGNNVTTAAHGFAPKAPNDAQQFLNGVAGYAVPAYPASALDDGSAFYLAMQDTSGILVLDVNGSPIYAPEVLPAAALVNAGSFDPTPTVLTATGTYTTPANSTTATKYLYRGVAAGGGSPGNNLADAFYGTPGAGAGEYVEGVVTGIAPGTVINITIPAGGTAGTSAPTSGGDGGDLVIGAPVSITAKGGKGALNVSAAAQAPGLGGNGPAGAPITIPGQSGCPGGLLTFGSAGAGGGGNSPWGAGGIWVGAAAAANPGLGFGAGAGGSRASGAASFAGAVGAPGKFIIQRISV